jgi:hypothetical protein
MARLSLGYGIMGPNGWEIATVRFFMRLLADKRRTTIGLQDD